MFRTYRRVSFSVSKVLAWFLLSLVAVSGLPRELRAGDQSQPADSSERDLPLAMVNVAGVERLLEDVDYTFEAVERPELAELIARLMFNLGDLKGLDLDKPLGVMVYVQSGFPPMPVAIGYVPVTSIEDLKKTAALSAMTLEDAEGEGRYELRLGAVSLSVRLRDGYAFLSTDPEMLDRNFPDPGSYAKPLTSRYDVGASLDLKTVPKGIMQLFIQYLRASVETNLQQRDNESDVRYALRKAQGMSNFDFLEQMLTQGEQLLIGWNVSSEKREAMLEVVINAAPESQFAKAFRDIAVKRSYFSRLLDEPVPFTASTSWKLSDSTKKVYAEMLNVLESELKARLGGEQGAVPDPALADILASLSDTVDLGHIDGFLQLQGEPPHAWVLVGGVKIANTSRFASGLTEVLRRIQERQAEGRAPIELNAMQRGGVSFHRIGGTQGLNEEQIRLFGEKSAFYVGAGQRAVWIAYGGEDVPSVLERAIQKVTEPADERAARDPDAPFQLMTHLSSWIAMTSDPANRMAALDAARNAFSTENDVIRVDFRPTENGARLRIVLQEGFIRYIGLRVVRQVDRRGRF